MKCKRCENEIRDDSIFCPFCGVNVFKDKKIEVFDFFIAGLAVLSLILSVIPLSEIIIWAGAFLGLVSLALGIFRMKKHKTKISFPSITASAAGFCCGVIWLVFLYFMA